MTEHLLPFTMLVATAACAMIAYRTYRSPDNWHIDGETKQLRFHNWPSIGIFAYLGTISAMTAYLLLI